MAPNFFLNNNNNFDMGVKNAEFDADFRSVEKIVKKFLGKKLLE
jgi:hypothetical protein